MVRLKKNQEIAGSKDRYVLFLVAFLLVFHLLCNINIRSISIAVDEVIPLGVAARIAGLDWSHSREFNYYYGYLSVLFYIPLFKIPAIYQNSYLLTQAVLGINSVFHVIMSALIYKTLRLLWPDTSKRVTHCLVTLASVCILQVFNVSLGAQVESLYCLCYTVVFYLIARISVGKAHFWEAALIGFFSYAAYANNTRGLVLLIASATVLLILTIADRKKAVMLLIFSIVAAGFLYLHKFVILPEYQSFFESDANNTSTASFIKKLKLVFTDSTYTKTFITVLMGWIWSCIVSTFGLFLIAGSATISYIYRFFKKKDVKSALLPTFVVLVYIGSLCLCVVNSIQAAYLQLEEQTGSRADVLFYVRYVTCSLPVLISYGMAAWADEKQLLRGRIFNAVIVAAVAALGWWFYQYIIEPLDGFRYGVNNSVFMAMFLKNFSENFRYGRVSVDNYNVMFTFILIFITVMVVIFRICEKKSALCIITIIQMIFCTLFVNTVAYPKSEYYATVLDQEVIDYCNESDARSIYMSDNAPTGQYRMPEKVVYGVYKKQDILILYSDQDHKMSLDDYDLMIRKEKYLVYAKKTLSEEE